MGVGHYENFPVASLLLPRVWRQAVALIYRFARTADDLADEGTAPASVRLAELEGLREELRRIGRGEPPQAPWLGALARLIHERRLPLEPFLELLSAFSQDVVRTRYRSFAELLDYCRRSANPIGRLLLALFGAATPAAERLSDAVCSGLQLVNFLQDVAIDYRKGRIYLPQDELARFGIAEEQIARGAADERWRRLMAFQAERARRMLAAGAPLARALGGRAGLELRLVVAGAERVLAKIEAADGDVFRRRPVLGWYDWPLLGLRAAAALAAEAATARGRPRSLR